MSLSVCLKNALPFADPSALMPEISAAHETLVTGSGRGSDFLGWVRLPFDYDRAEFARVKAAAAKIRAQSELLIVIGIGGSYLGARAAIEYVNSPNYNMFRKAGTPLIVFAGNSLSSDQAQEIIDLAADKDFSINVISKSGTTTEPAISFRIFKALAEKKYGDAARERIFATTDAARGALKTLADASGYECFVIPDNIGGRYSVLTPVGLLPIAVAGIDIDEMMRGAADTAERLRTASSDNPAWQYAAARNALYRKGFTTEIIAAFEPRFRYMGEWWKQLYGESEGKENKGIFPASVDLTADLHSMGQYIQQGLRNLFETVIAFDGFRTDVKVPSGDKLDGLDFLVGRELSEINDMAAKGTALAHVDGGVPNLKITVGRADAYSFGELVYFFEFACGLSGYTLGVNPFDQPGVEAYKKNMFALIGKPGYEEMREALAKRL